ncbi:MAG: hypothetical protein H6622_10945 [Halobacteriovoraceae bacterium]|nr:hypothetical protein [Halobacteriovoraceae bacterium]
MIKKKAKQSSLGEEYKEKEKSVIPKRGFLKNKKLMRKGKLPLTLDEMQAIAQSEDSSELENPCLDKLEISSSYGPSGDSYIRFYDRLHSREVIAHFNYPSHHSTPKNISKRNESGFYTFLSLGTYDERGTIITIGNGVRFGAYLFDDKLKLTLQGNDNAHENELIYSLHDLVFREVKKVLKREIDKAERFYKSIFIFKQHRFKRDYKFRHKFKTVEFFWVIRSFSPKEDYKRLVKLIEDRYGYVTARITTEGTIQDEIKFRFQNDELGGVVLKIYRFDDDLIKFEVQFTSDYFGKGTKDYRFLEVCPIQTLAGLRKRASSLFVKLLSNSFQLNELSYPYETCEKKFRKLCPKYSDKIIDMFKVGNGFCRINSSLSPNLYRSISKLVKAGLVYKQRKSNYQLADSMKSLIQKEV